ncbi:RNA-directed DNA polymerase [Camponotus japonicus]
MGTSMHSMPEIKGDATQHNTHGSIHPSHTAVSTHTHGHRRTSTNIRGLPILPHDGRQVHALGRGHSTARHHNGNNRQEHILRMDSSIRHTSPDHNGPRSTVRG